MKLSVVIPCYNAAETIADELEALAQQSVQPWEVIVADNGSTDRSKNIIAQYQDRLPNLQIVDASDRRGAAHARNCGVEVATGDAIAFCDADDMVAPGWIAAMSEALEKYDFVASCHENQKLNGPNSNSTQATGLQHFSPAFLPHAGGCGLGIKTEIHRAVGGFDVTMPYLEDTEYCLRVQLAGYPLHFVSDAVIHIRQRSSAKGLYQQGFRWAKGFALLYSKYQAQGMTKIPVVPALRNLAGFLSWSLRCLFSGKLNQGWLWHLGWRMGILAGSFQYRVMAFRVEPWNSERNTRTAVAIAAPIPVVEPHSAA